MPTPEELERNLDAFRADVAQAQRSGRKFRTEHRADGMNFVHYLTQEEIDWHIQQAAEEQAQIVARAAAPLEEKLARVGLTVADIQAALGR
jgi:hypothetical protein